MKKYKFELIIIVLQLISLVILGAIAYNQKQNYTNTTPILVTDSIGLVGYYGSKKCYRSLNGYWVDEQGERCF